MPRADELVLTAASGVWVVRAGPMQPFFIDTDAYAVGRERLPDGTTTQFDTRWLLIHAIVGPDDWDVVRIGDRHLYFLAPPDDSAEGGCWYQDPAEKIEHATEVELSALPARIPPSQVHRSDPRVPLVLAQASGVWAVRSTSRTVYYVDADASTLLRHPGPGSSAGPGDDRWVPLVALESSVGGDVGMVRVGERHRWVFDYSPSGPEYGWWLQRAVTAVEPVGAEELASLPPRSGRAR